MNEEKIKIQWCELCDKRIGDTEFMEDADGCLAHKACVKQLSKYYQKRWY